MNLFYLKCLFALLIPLCTAAQSRSKPVVIAVDDVTPATTPYNTFDSRKILEQATSKPMIVTSSMPDQLVPAAPNSFIETVHLAYSQHHDLVLSPDDIWIQIALGVSIHINQNFEQLNGRVLHSPEKEELFVRLDSLATLQPDYWQQLIDTFAIMARQKVKPEFYATMLPEFSTSTPQTRSVLNAILLSSVKESVYLRGASGCGIPHVVLLGTKADWETILARLDQLAQYDLQFWTDELKPVLREFVNAFDGRIDRQFWQQIYKYRQGYMMMQMNGWISKFFPYFTEGEPFEDQAAADAYAAENPGVVIGEWNARTTYVRNPYLKGDDYLLHAIDIWSLPSSVCDIPLIWHNLLSKNPQDHEQHLTLCAGLMGTVQDKDLRLHNNPVWYIVRRDDLIETDYDQWLNAGKEVDDYSPYLWSNDVLDSVSVIYNPEHNETAIQGYTELKKELRDHLKRTFPKEDLAGTELSFVVTHFGSCANVNVIKSKLSDLALVELALKMRKLEHRFQPTTIDFDDSKDFIQAVEESPDKVPANALITLNF